MFTMDVSRPILKPTHGSRRSRAIRVALIVGGATACLGIASAYAGPCTQQVDQFEVSVRQSSKTFDAGPSGTETTGAKLHHQPTPESVQRATQTANAKFAETLARAKDLDAEGKGAECMHLLNNAKLMFNAQ
jgi:hypothetical protein